MKIELIIVAITAFFMFNTYNDGKYTKIFKDNKKYIQMAFYGLMGLSIYLLFKKNPDKGKNLLLHANNMVKYLPIDRSSASMISPIIDFTNTYSQPNLQPNSFMGNLNAYPMGTANHYERKIMQSGHNNHGNGKATKRSVSETKKKFVASQQKWKCGDCKNQLNAWFEVDHKVRLEHGGGNDVSNLVALCRDCHGKKTAMENM